jgi:hypothetical protein
MPPPPAGSVHFRIRLIRHHYGESGQGGLSCSMIRYVDEPACDHYVESLAFIENQIKETLEVSDWDFDLHPEAEDKVKALVAKIISEYDSYIKFTIEIDPYGLKVIKTLRNSKQFWIDWREENLG